MADNYARVGGGKTLEFYIHPRDLFEVNGTSEMYRIGQNIDEVFGGGYKVILFKNADDVHGVADNYMVGIGNELLIRSAKASEFDDSKTYPIIQKTRRRGF